MFRSAVLIFTIMNKLFSVLVCLTFGALMFKAQGYINEDFNSFALGEPFSTNETVSEDVKIYHLTINDKLANIELRGANDNCLSILKKNTYIIVELSEGLFEFDVCLGVKATFSVYRMPDGIDNLQSLEKIERSYPAVVSNDWNTVGYTITTKGTYAIKYEGDSGIKFCLDNLRNIVSESETNKTVLVYVNSEINVPISGLNISVGNEVLTEVANGKYFLNISTENFNDELYSALRIEADGYKIFGDTNVALGDDETVVSLLAVKEKSYTVSGTVINEWYSMVEGLTVELLYDGMLVDDVVLTDENGEFELHYTPVHFTPKDVSEFSDAEEEPEAGTVKMYAYAEADDDKHEGYQLRLTHGDIYRPQLIDIAAPVAGETESKLDDAIKMESWTITTVKSTDIINVTINGKPYHVPEAASIVNAQGIIVAKIIPSGEITLIPGLYFAAGKKLIVR